MRRMTGAVAVAAIMAVALLAASAIPGGAVPITGDINVTGNDSYSTTSHSVTFIGGQNLQSDTGTLASLGTCFGCVSATSFTYNPFNPVSGLYSATNNGITFSFDFTSLTSITETAAALDLAGSGVLHETGFAATPGDFFFSTQGPQGTVQVSFSSTATTPVSVPEPSALLLLGAGLGVLGLVKLIGGRRRHAV